MWWFFLTPFMIQSWLLLNGRPPYVESLLANSGQTTWPIDVVGLNDFASVCAWKNFYMRGNIMNSHLMIRLVYSTNKNKRLKKVRVEQHIGKWYTYLMPMIDISNALWFLDKNMISGALSLVALNLIFLELRNRSWT